MDLRAQMDRIYRELEPDAIPWNLAEPPALLVDLVESGRIAPCRAIDLGCGAGNHAVWLAERGFEMTGIDLSAAAIELARRRARDARVVCRFVAADLRTHAFEDEAGFDFAYDWEVLHHVFPEDRPAYVDGVHRLLRPGGRHLSVCFSEQSPSFGGPAAGNYRTTPFGTTLYHSSETELRRLFQTAFEIVELDTREIPGRHGTHLAIVAFLVRR